MVADDGNTYERQAIEKFLAESDGEPVSPLTRTPITRTFPNRIVRDMIHSAYPQVRPFACMCLLCPG